MWYWSDFDTYDDQTLIPVNLTQQDMALLRSAISVMDSVDAWGDAFDYYSEVVPLIETIEYLIRGD